MPLEPKEICKKLLSQNPLIREEGYQNFLESTYWPAGTTVEDIKRLACRHFNVRPDLVLAELKTIEPQILWASQDGLQYEKLRMVEAAADYCKIQKIDLPPITVWRLHSGNMRFIIHDGHHRAYYSYRYNVRLHAVIMDPIGAYEKIEQSLSYAFELHKRGIDLPITRHDVSFDSEVTPNDP